MRRLDKPANRSAPAKALADRKFRQRIVRDKTKYDRKRKDNGREAEMD